MDPLTGSPLGPAPEDLLTKLFPGLSRVDLAKLTAHLEPRQAAEGEEIVRQGDAGDSLYLVAGGRLGVFVASSGAGSETRVGTLLEGDLFGEMALFTNEPRSATVRADSPCSVLRLERARFLELLRKEPMISLAIAATLSRRLQSANIARAQSQNVIAASVDQALGRLPADRRAAVLEAGLLREASERALAALFGDRARAVAEDLAAFGISSGAAAPAVLRVLRERLAHEEGAERLQARADRIAGRLADAQCWEDALGVLARQPSHRAFAQVLGRALRGVPPLAPDRAARWIERLTDDEAAQDEELALARAALHESRGDSARALALLRRALGAALVAQEQASGRRLSAEIARLSGAGRGSAVAGAGVGLGVHDAEARPPSGRWRAGLCVGASVILGALAGWPGGGSRWVFVALLLAAIALMMSRLWPDFAVGLALVAAWVLSGLAKPAEALAGFATKEWLFVIAVYGLAAAAARSGVLFRVGLLLVRRLPHSLFWQTGTLLLTGIALTPLVPSSTGRASLTSPLALAVAEALRLPDRSRSSALLGLGAWIGAGPLMFIFLNGSGTCLLAWGLLPEPSRARFTWIQWFVAAAPLGLVICVGALGLLFLMQRKEAVARPSREGLSLQVAVLGPPAARELATIAVLVLTVTGWIAAPRLGVDLATVAVLGLLAAITVGSFDLRALQGLDWNTLLFFGVVLTIARIGVSVGLDRAAAAAISGLLGDFRPGPLTFVLAVAVLSVVVRLVMEQDLTLLLASLTLIPVAPSVGVEPWVVVITLLATSVAWFLPSQTTSYIVAQSASEGRLFSHAQAQHFAVAYVVLTLLGLALSVPYWRFLGLL